MPSPRRPKRRRPPDPPNHERWLVSYADFVTLLFAFFTAMYAISTVDAKKLSAMVESTQQAFESKPTKTADGRILVGKEPAAKKSEGEGPGGEVGLADLQKQVTARLAKQIIEKQVEIERDPRGLVISIREAGAFAAGRADLSKDAQSLLLEVGSMLAGIGNQLRVEGHTDDTPIHTARFASNWELSTTRATTVVSFLLEHASVRPEQVSAAGYAEYHPRVDNSSDANRLRNRRVDLIMLNPSAEAPKGPTKAAAP